MVSKRPSVISVYQLTVTLKDSKPPIWRRIQVQSELSLYKLHRVLQVVMGWTDSHLHQFIIGGRYYGAPDPEFEDMEVVNERRVKLSQVVAYEKERFVYEYDFGDNWLHQITVDKILPPAAGKGYSVCLAGKRSAPPEDCGGIWGYQDFLEAISDPNRPEHKETLEWLGGDFDPEAFELDEVNRELRGLR
ncbi:MAG: plasmid pRiA4b ORF-3 family protein [Chloroflexi bacterium]|nr:plasmid pRiA4b ORF-3 family protein [Chloroflexota bacterium]